MLQIPLSPAPNQTFTVLLNGQNVTINLQTRTTLGKQWLYMDISIGGNYIIAGVKCIGGTPVIPYDYLATQLGGNFFFATANNNSDYPDYQQFNITQSLLFYTSADLQ